MRVRLDADRCVGHGRCYDLAPDVFAEDARGHCQIRQAVVAPGSEESARAAIDNCPEGALSIDEISDRS